MPICRAKSILSAISNSTPRDIFSNRPAAFNRGAIAKPKSAACKLLKSRLLTSAKALIPTWQAPERIRLNP